MKIVTSLVTLLLMSVSFFTYAEWKPTKQQYNKIESDLIAFESVRYCPYVGLNGVMTIGIGQAIGTRYEVTKSGRTYHQTRLWSLERINNLFKTADVKQMTSGQYQQIVNLKKQTNRILKKKHFKIGEYYKKQPRQNVYCLNKKDNDKELMNLVRHSINYHLTAMANQSEKLDIDLNGLPDEIIEFVFDLFYRGGPGLVLGPNTPSINAAINNKDILTIFEEGFARSNADLNKQNDIRNAYYTALGMKLLSTDQKLAFKKFLQHNKAAKKTSERIKVVVKGSPQSIPPHAKQPVIDLALKKNVFLDL